MKFAHIVPIDNLWVTRNQPYHMFLTHLVKKSDIYKGFGRMCKGYKILDNSLIELGDSVDLEDLCYAATAIYADEIVLPDTFMDGEKTFKRIWQSLTQLATGSAIVGYVGETRKKMAVIHGKNIDEWFRCFRRVIEIDEIDTIGIPKVTHKMHEEGRAWFVNAVADDIINAGKEIHLLGLWCELRELEQIKDLSKIRSIDSCFAALLAKNNYPICYGRPDGETINLEKDFINYETLQSKITEVNDYVANITGVSENI